MSLFLSVTAFLLSVSAIVVGAEALRRINGQNEEFLKSYVQQIRTELARKDDQMATLRRELKELRQIKQSSRETLAKLEQQTGRQRDARVETFHPKEMTHYGDFIPSPAQNKDVKIA